MTLEETESDQVVKAYNSNYFCYFSVNLKLSPNKKTYWKCVKTKFFKSLDLKIILMAALYFKNYMLDFIAIAVPH